MNTCWLFDGYLMSVGDIDTLLGLTDATALQVVDNLWLGIHLTAYDACGRTTKGKDTTGIGTGLDIGILIEVDEGGLIGGAHHAVLHLSCESDIQRAIGFDEYELGLQTA